MGSCIIEDGEAPLKLHRARDSTDGGSFVNSGITYLYLGRNIASTSSYDGYYSPFLSLQSLEEVVIGGKVTTLPTNTFVYKDQLRLSPLPYLTKLTILPNKDGENNELRFVKDWERDGIPDFYNVEQLQVCRNIIWEDINKNTSIFSKLVNVELNDDFSHINAYFFKNCKDLSSVKIWSKKLESIGANSFEGVENLSTLLCNTVIPPVFEGDPKFSNSVYINTTLYVPNQSIEAYSKADFWKKFWNIKPLDESTGITSTEAPNGAMNVIPENDGIRVLNKDAHSVVQVYSIHGAKMAETSEDTVRHLSKGIYIVTVGAKSFKVFVR